MSADHFHKRELPKKFQRLIHDLHDIRAKVNDACAVADLLVIEEMNKKRQGDEEVQKDESSDAGKEAIRG